MNAFIKIVMTMIDITAKSQEDELIAWFMLIQKIKNQPSDGGLDISIGLKKEIEKHFFYFWDNDRTQVLKNKLDYFDAIPFWIKEKIMCNFMFADVFSKTAF
jgi:hypothetical protein